MTAVKAQTQARARRIAGTVPLSGGGFAGFDFGALTLLLQELIPLIISCFQPDDGPAAQKYVRSKWTESKGYDPQLLNRMTRAARRSAWRKRRVYLSWAQGEILARATLDDVRLEPDPNQMSAVVFENLRDDSQPDDEVDWNL